MQNSMDASLAMYDNGRDHVGTLFWSTGEQLAWSEGVHTEINERVACDS